MNDIDALIKLLDSKTESGVSRIKVETSEEIRSGEYEYSYHHGRCDVGSCFADGSIRNLGEDPREDRQ